MPRPRYAHLTGYDPKTVPFDSAEEAWFWCMCNLALRRMGARPERDKGAFARPCEPDDIAVCAAALLRCGRLTKGHINVLAAYGAAERAPDRRAPGETGHAVLWEEALDRMTGPLRAKGVVRAPDAADTPPPPPASAAASASAAHPAPARRAAAHADADADTDAGAARAG